MLLLPPYLASIRPSLPSFRSPHPNLFVSIAPPLFHPLRLYLVVHRASTCLSLSWLIDRWPLAPSALSLRVPLNRFSCAHPFRLRSIPLSFTEFPCKLPAITGRGVRRSPRRISRVELWFLVKIPRENRRIFLAAKKGKWLRFRPGKNWSPSRRRRDNSLRSTRYPRFIMNVLASTVDKSAGKVGAARIAGSRGMIQPRHSRQQRGNQVSDES